MVFNCLRTVVKVFIHMFRLNIILLAYSKSEPRIRAWEQLGRSGGVAGRQLQTHKQTTHIQKKTRRHTNTQTQDTQTLKNIYRHTQRDRQTYRQTNRHTNISHKKYTKINTCTHASMYIHMHTHRHTQCHTCTPSTSPHTCKT